MNEKGFTVVELIVSFVLVMTISIGLFTTVDSYRANQQQEVYRKTVNSYLNEILITIQNDNIKNNGIVNIENESVLKSSGSCYGFNEGIKITYKNNTEKYLCVGNGRILNGTGTSASTNGILYGDFFFKKPTKFIEFVDDILYTHNVYNNTDVWSISISAKHTELSGTFTIDIVSPQEKPST